MNGEIFVYGSYYPEDFRHLLLRREWTLDIDETLFQSMPRVRTGSVELEFFRNPHTVMLADLDCLMERRKRTLVDPFGLMSWNLAHPEYPGEYPNGTHWKNASGDYCAMLFHEQQGLRVVSILKVRPPGLWTPEWMLAHYGARYSSAST